MPPSPSPVTTRPNDAETDAVLAKAALAGDDEALGHLLARHEPAAYRVACRLLPREADAQDAVQEAFLLAVRAVRGGASPRDLDRVKPWLLRIVANVALGQLRRRPAAPPVPVEALTEVLPAPEQLEPERQAERREVRGDVLRALLALPSAQRAALALREYEGLSYGTIGELLGLDQNATAQLLFRARQSLRAAHAGLTTTPRSVGCPELAAQVAALLDSELPGGAWRRIVGHVKACACCRGELAELRRVRRASPSRPTAVPSPARFSGTARWRPTRWGGTERRSIRTELTAAAVPA